MRMNFCFGFPNLIRKVVRKVMFFLGGECFIILLQLGEAARGLNIHQRCKAHIYDQLCKGSRKKSYSLREDTHKKSVFLVVGPVRV